MNDSPQTTRPVNFIRFHGLNLLVVEHEGVEYIPAKPLCDLSAVDWKSAKRTLQRGDNAILYGVKRLLPPEIDGQRGDITPRNEVLYIHLDRSQMYLARISTDRMRAHGNEAGADYVLALQLDYAQVLHQWETTGIVVRRDRGNAIKQVIDLQRAMATAKPEQRGYLKTILDEVLRELGVCADASTDADQIPLALGRVN